MALKRLHYAYVFLCVSRDEEGGGGEGDCLPMKLEGFVAESLNNSGITCDTRL